MGKINFKPEGTFFEGLIQNATGAQPTTAPQQNSSAPTPFYMTFQLYEKSQEVVSNCNQITFLNLGTSNLFLNNTVPLPQWWFFTSPGEWDEIDTTQYLIHFDNTGTNLCLVIRKNKTGI